MSAAKRGNQPGRARDAERDGERLAEPQVERQAERDLERDVERKNDRGGGRRPDLAAAFIHACTLDVAVMKPGNVSQQSPGHGMTAAQFLASAAAAAPLLCEAGASIGRRILGAVEATWAVARCNTNLGIVLLCAPLASALEGIRVPAEDTLRQALQRDLRALTVDDGQDAFRAIARANPGGLGTVDEQDVRSAPTLDLLAAMALAAERDLIARQYVNGFADIFDTGLVAWRRVRSADTDAHAHAMQCVFLTFLARFPDSHLVRKHGLTAAQVVSDEAERWLSRVVADGPSAQAGLAAWDARLKASGLNPGTSADLAVATAFIAEVLLSRSADVATCAG